MRTGRGGVRTGRGGGSRGGEESGEWGLDWAGRGGQADNPGRSEEYRRGGGQE